MITPYAYTCFLLFLTCTNASESSPLQLLVDPSGSLLTAVPPLFIPVPSSTPFRRYSFRFILHRRSTALRSGSFFTAVPPLLIVVGLLTGTIPRHIKEK
ncbi:hypothetical protein HOY80DRAFT_225937 [Tuber brumale]|nr:hypothetical protein HOY80DRAFT_225937 [Tuber brumale]